MGLRELALESLPGSLGLFAADPARVAPSMAKALASAVCFSFATDVDQGIYQFGLELLAHQVFALPSEAVWLEFYPVPDQKVGILAVSEPGDGIRIAAFGFVADPNVRNPKGADVQITGNLYLRDDWQWEVPNLRDPRHDEAFRNNSNRLLADLIFLVGLLNSKGLTRTEKPAPERLNKHRIRSGKPPINAVIEIKVPAEYAYGGADAAAGMRASPRPHFRRGHVRRHGEGLVLVRPTWVLGGPEVVAPKSYRVVGPGMH